MSRLFRRTPLFIVLGAMVMALGGLAFMVRTAPHASADQGAAVSIVEPDHSNSETWHFDPGKITVKPGTTVTWTWKGTEKHSVTADDGSFDSGVRQGTGQTWSHKFDKPGTYPYSCTPHPTMTGEVDVK